MLTSGPEPITPKIGYFDQAKTMFSPTTAPPFYQLWWAATDCSWNNTTKFLTTGMWPDGSPPAGLAAHIFDYPFTIEDWGTVSYWQDDWPLGCGIPNIDLPNGSNYTVTFGAGYPLSLPELEALLRAYTGSDQGYVFRYGYLWTNIPPSWVTHGTVLLHFDGWLD